MTTTSRGKVTQLLLDRGEGDEAALQQLVPLVHKELHQLAHHYMARERRHVHPRLVFSSLTENADIWSLPIDAAEGRVTGDLEQLTRDLSC